MVGQTHAPPLLLEHRVVDSLRCPDRGLAPEMVEDVVNPVRVSVTLLAPGPGPGVLLPAPGGELLGGEAGRTQPVHQAVRVGAEHVVHLDIMHGSKL